MNKKIGFAIPGLYENFEINKILINIKKQYPECFYNINIDAIYGNFQFCIWDGGRIFTNPKHATLEQIQNIKEFINDENHLPLRFIYTNNQLKSKHLSDRFCNLVTELCEDELNEIVVNSPIMEDYIRTNYPKYKIISSTTKCLKNQDLANQELENDNYFRVCIDYNLNHNIEFLNNLSEIQKEKVEILVNPICGANCQNREKHYKLNSLFSLTYGKKYKLDSCNIPGKITYPFSKKIRNEILINDILTTYIDIGISHYKIEGRTFAPLLHLQNCVKYLVKPEYQFFIIESIWEQYERNQK